MRLILTCLLLVISAHQMAVADMTNADAFSLGKSIGDVGKDKNFSGINNSNASANVPGYSTSSSESQYYQDGMGTITPPANADVDNCMSKTTDADKQSHGHCESVRMINQSKGKAKSMFTLDSTKDPLLTKGKDAQKNPSQYTGSTATGGDYSGCQQKTVKDPDVYEEEVCNEYVSRAEYNCSEKLTVEVFKTENCTPLTWGFTNYTTWNNAGNHFEVDSKCSTFDTSGTVDLQIAISGAGGCGGYPSSYSFSIPAYTTVSAAKSVGSPVLMVDFRGVSGSCNKPVNSITYTHNGCPGNKCQTSVTFGSINTFTGQVQVMTTTKLDYEPYKITYTYKDTWDDQCKQFKDRMQ